MKGIPDYLIALFLIIVSLIIIFGLSLYSLIKISFLKRKRYVLTPLDQKRPDAGLTGVDLSRDMTVTQATMTGVGAMIGAGIFVLTGIAAGRAGPGLLVAFAFNGIIATLIAMVYAELGSAMPEAGGGYVWARAGLGETQGFFSGWLSWFAAAVAGSLYSLGFAAYFVTLLSNYGIIFESRYVFIIEKIIAALAITIFLWINQSGSSVMGKAETWISGTKVIILTFFILVGVSIITFNPNLASENFTDFFPLGFFSIFTAMGFTFIAFEGYEVVCQTGEEIYDPKINIPKAVILSILIVIPIYILVGFVSIGAFSIDGQTTWQFLSNNEELGLLYAAEQMIPGLGFIVILYGGILSTLSALNAAIYSSTRVAFALARDGSLPNKLGEVSKKTHTPTISIWVTGIIIILMAVLIPIEAVATSADLIYMILFAQVLIAAIIIRRKMRGKKQNKKLKNEFKTPLLDYGYKTPFFPLIPILGIFTLIIVFLFTVLLHIEAIVATSLWLIVGTVTYIIYARKRTPMEPFSKLEKHLRPRIDYLPESFFSTVLENIIVPVKGIYEIEWDALRIAIFIAHEFGCRITIYHYGYQTEDEFNNYFVLMNELKIQYECKITKPLKKNPSENDIIQNLIDTAGTGEYQLLIAPTRRHRRFWQKSTSYSTIRSVPIPGLQVIPSETSYQKRKLIFNNVGALTPGTKRDAFLLQIGIAIVSSIKLSNLIAYHWTHVPKLITPQTMSEAPGVKADTLAFLQNLGDAIFTYGVPIEQRHILGHDFIRSMSMIIKKDKLDLILLGHGKPRLGRKLSIGLASKIPSDCTALIFHGRPSLSDKETNY